MKILIFRIGKGKCRWADLGTQEWLKRIQKRLPVQEVLLKPAPDHFPIEKRRLIESNLLLSKLKEGDTLICLDERGSLFTTEDFSSVVQKAMNRSSKRLVFAIGGPFGHAPQLRKEAWQTMALSKMVVNHEMARLMLAEQLYRVYTLIWGGDYHH